MDEEGGKGGGGHEFGEWVEVRCRIVPFNALKPE